MMTSSGLSIGVHALLRMFSPCKLPLCDVDNLATWTAVSQLHSHQEHRTCVCSCFCLFLPARRVTLRHRAEICPSTLVLTSIMGRAKQSPV